MRSLVVTAILSVQLLALSKVVHAQRYLTDYDSTFFLRDTVRPVIKRFENLHISGYIQPQYQVAQSQGAPSYEGGNFSKYSNNRFMLRRARVKLDYFFPSKRNNLPAALFTFQLDATERGVNVRDMFARIYEPKAHNFSLTMGLFARPFGYEINLSSAFRETPERGRMSQKLMPTERDLGAMITYEPQRKNGKVFPLKWDIAIANGQGLASGGITDFDAYKDVISRITLKPVKLGPLEVSGGLSHLNGGWRQATRYRWEMDDQHGMYRFTLDSSLSNIGDKAERKYYGADLQLAYKHGWGKTELRGEYWRGTQPGTAKTTVNPGVLPLDPTFIRPFDGAFLLFLQNLGNSRNELMVKYDWYDPNRLVKGMNVNASAGNFSAADVRFNTLGLGLTRHFSSQVKFLLYYSIVRNEKTAIEGYTEDLEDNVLTARFHFRF